MQRFPAMSARVWPGAISIVQLCFAALLLAFVVVASASQEAFTPSSGVPGSTFGQSTAQPHRIPVPDDACLSAPHCIENFDSCCQEHHDEFPGRKHPKGLPGVTSLQHLKLRKETCNMAKAELLKRAAEAQAVAAEHEL